MKYFLVDCHFLLPLPLCLLHCLSHHHFLLHYLVRCWQLCSRDYFACRLRYFRAQGGPVLTDSPSVSEVWHTLCI